MIIKSYSLGEIPISLMTHAVIMTRYCEEWVFVKRKDKDTWEVPGGRIEEGEDIFKCAARELNEETGALRFALIPITIYGMKDYKQATERYGMLFYAMVYELGELPPHTEIRVNQFSEKFPMDLTYPDSMPHLINVTLEFLKQFNIE
jgi:8-oxo-dGTP diphosphatase